MEQNKDLIAIKDRLAQSQKEQTKITIYLKQHHFSGTVIRVENECVELRMSDDKIILRLCEVSAIQYK